MSVAIGKNTVVSLRYQLADADGTVLEKAEEALVYLHGGHHGIFPLVEAELEGKAVGHACTVRLVPDDAFGERDDSLIRTEPRSLFPKNVAVGMQFQGSAQGSSHVVVYTVTDVSGDNVVVDANHPLAGRTVEFTCTVVDVRQATREELDHGHVHGAGGHHH
jgi:FKBP-type peptidyl-prolyl cis-trans isomerase SlyD